MVMIGSHGARLAFSGKSGKVKKFLWVCKSQEINVGLKVSGNSCRSESLRKFLQIWKSQEIPAGLKVSDNSCRSVSLRKFL